MMLKVRHMRVRRLSLALFVFCLALLLGSCASEGVSLLCGCGAPPRCGATCNSTCGCCDVGPPGPYDCTTDGIVVNSTQNCYDVVPCSGPNRCVFGSAGPVCAESASDCNAVRTAYEAQLRWSMMETVRSDAGPLDAGTYPNVQCPEACRVSAGNCAQGLDTCWFLSYGPDAERDRLANLYQELGCPALGPCNCPPAPVASCQYDASRSQGDYGGPLTCTVE
jgi:hypothetical protein